MVDTEQAKFRAYRPTDNESVASLWTRINRELAPAHLKDEFERYISGALLGELENLEDTFSPRRRNRFWVVECSDTVIGTFGIERQDDNTTELRRMYLEQSYRGRGIAQRMLRCAEDNARGLGFTRMILSTAEIQEAALAFYRKSGYRLIKTEVADAMSKKMIGGGLTRYYFQRDL